MFPKYKLLMNHFDVTRKDLYYNLLLELQNIYPDIDLSQMQDDYCFENRLDCFFTMDVIEHNKELRALFEHMVDDLLIRYKLKSDTDGEYTLRKQYLHKTFITLQPSKASSCIQYIIIFLFTGSPKGDWFVSTFYARMRTENFRKEREYV